MIEDYLHDHSDRYSAATLEAKKRWLGYFFARFEDVSKLGPEDLTKYRQELTWNPGPRGHFYSENTVNQAVDTLRGFYRWAVANGRLPKDLTTHLKGRRGKSRPKTSLSLEEIRKLLAEPDLTTAMGLRDRAILRLLAVLEIGTRECSKLDLGDVQLDTGMLKTTRRGQRKLYSIPEEVVSDLKTYLDHSRELMAQPNEVAFFITKQGNRMLPASCRRVLRVSAERARVRIP